MCWNWQVSLCFSLFQWILIAYMIYRHKYMDRWLAVMQIPIATQEFLQFLLWAFGIDDNTTSSKCTFLNQYLSYNLLIIVMVIPPLYGFVYFYKSADFVNFQSIFTSNWRPIILFIMFIFQCILYILHIVIAIIYDIHYGDSHCSFKGKNGHQEWAMMAPNIEPTLHWGYINLIQFGYIFITIYPIFTYRPLWIFLFPYIYGFISSLVFILWTTPNESLLTFSSKIPSNTGEWGSLWCWANSIQIIWFCFVSPIIPKVLQKYNEEELESIAAKILFGGSKALFENNGNEKITNKPIQHSESEMQRLNDQI